MAKWIPLHEAEHQPRERQTVGRPATLLIELPESLIDSLDERPRGLTGAGRVLTRGHQLLVTHRWHPGERGTELLISRHSAPHSAPA